MHILAASTKRTLVDFLRDEAPLEYERLKSIGRLASPSLDDNGDRSDLTPLSYARWVRDALVVLPFDDGWSRRPPRRARGLHGTPTTPMASRSIA